MQTYLCQAALPRLHYWLEELFPSDVFKVDDKHVDEIQTKNRSIPPLEGLTCCKIEVPVHNNVSGTV